MRIDQQVTQYDSHPARAEVRTMFDIELNRQGRRRHDRTIVRRLRLEQPQLQRPSLNCQRNIELPLHASEWPSRRQFESVIINTA